MTNSHRKKNEEYKRKMRYKDGDNASEFPACRSRPNGPKTWGASLTCKECTHVSFSQRFISPPADPHSPRKGNPNVARC